MKVLPNCESKFPHNVERRKNLCHAFFSQFNLQERSLVISKTLIWRNFCGNSVAVFFVKSICKCTMWKLLHFSLTRFWQKFRESNVFNNKITKELIWRNILVRLQTWAPQLTVIYIRITVIWDAQVCKFFVFPHCGNYGNSLTHFWQKFRQSNGFTK